MQIQLWNQVSDLLRPFGKQRQYPAFKNALLDLGLEAVAR